MTPGLDPGLSRLRGGAKAGECRLCPSSEESSPQLGGVRVIILNLFPGWSTAVRRWGWGSLVTDSGRPAVSLAPAMAAPGLPPTSCPALEAGPSLGEGRRRKRGGTALIQIPDQPPCMDFILPLPPKGRSRAPPGTPGATRSPHRGPSVVPCLLIKHSWTRK